MRQRRPAAAAAEPTPVVAEEPTDNVRKHGRSTSVWFALVVILLNGCWAVHYYQNQSLPPPLNAEQAGKRGFAEAAALEHVKYLANLGPHPVGSDALDLGIQYVLAECEKIKKSAHWEVDVQVDLFHAEIGANRLVSGLFKGKTIVYADLKHVVLRILPKYLPEAEEDVILISSHIDTVFSTGGAGDCSSCVAVMLELARGISQWAHGFKNGVIFLFNTGEEEGLNGAHSFITQHPWRNTINFFVDLEAMGIGGKSGLFQTGTEHWAIETFARVAKYPSGQIVAQDLFLAGIIKSGTDFQVYKEVGGLSGLDFAFTEATAVYHTKNDKLKLLKPGSLQHLGENMLAFLLEASTSPNLHKKLAVKAEGSTGKSQPIFFDVLGMYMVVYSQKFASMLYNSVILQSLLIWTTSLIMGGYPGAVTFGISCLSIVLMWLFSLSFSALVAFVLPLFCTSPIPYIANPWLVSGLFGAPAVLGALAGQHIGFLLLQKYLKHTLSSREPRLSPNIQENVIKWEAERWLYKGGLIQWLSLLILGNYFKVGSSYLALVWLVSPAFAYGLMEATLSPMRLPKQLKLATLILGSVVPVLLSAGTIIQLIGLLTGILVRFERNPGGTHEWLGNLMVAAFIAAVVSLTLVYMLSYVHISGAKRSFVLSVCALFGLTLAAVSIGIVPTFTEDIARTVNVVHVVEAPGRYDNNQDPLSYISLFSTTPGKLTDEAMNLKDEEFSCGTNRSVDFVGFTVKYGCFSFKDSGYGWSKSDIPTIHVESDSTSGDRQTRVLIDTAHSIRWTLAINTEEISDFTFEANSEEVVPLGGKIQADGWHIIQFSGGKSSPTKFYMNLSWVNDTKHSSEKGYGARDGSSPLLKLRTDVNRITPQTARVLEKLPPWCALFGKSTSPYTLAFLTSLPVDF